MQHQAVANEPRVHKDVNRIAIEPLQLGLGNKAGEAQVTGVWRFVVFFALPRRRLRQAGAGEVHLSGDRQHQRGSLRAEDLKEPFAGVGDGWRDEQCLGGRVQLEVARRVREGIVRHQRSDVLQLGRLRLEELAARRCIEEEVADGNRRSLRQPCLFDTQDIAAGDLDQCAGVILGRTRLERDPRYARDAWQGLAAKAKGGDREQIVRGSEL